MDFKYLSDGRKVAVIGQLNNNETIVQEVFITRAGDEIPGGERFVTKSLHDQPVVSWREKEAKKIEDHISSLESDRENIKHQIDRLMVKQKTYTDILRNLPKLSEYLPEEELEVFSMFMTGSIEYLVVDNYSISKPIKMIDEIIQWDSGWGERRYEGLKLLSVLGKSKGKLDYCIHRYSDGSGGYGSCYPFANHDDAVAHIKNRAEKKIEDYKLSDSDYEVCQELGIAFSQKHINMLAEYNRKKLAELIKSKQSLLSKNNDDLKALQDDLNKWS